MPQYQEVPDVTDNDVPGVVLVTSESDPGRVDIVWRDGSGNDHPSGWYVKTYGVYPTWLQHDDNIQADPEIWDIDPATGRAKAV